MMIRLKGLLINEMCEIVGMEGVWRMCVWRTLLG